MSGPDFVDELANGLGQWQPRKAFAGLHPGRLLSRRVLSRLLLCPLFAGESLPRLAERLRDDKIDKQDEDDVAAEGHVEKRDERAGPLDEVASEERPDGEADEQARMQVSEGNAALGRRRAVARVRMGDDATGSQGASEAVEEGSEQKPVVVDYVGEVGGENGDDLADDAAERADNQETLPTVPVRERAELRGRDGAEDAGYHADGQRKGSDIPLYVRRETFLGDVAPDDDGAERKVGIQSRLLLVVPVAHQRDDPMSESQRHFDLIVS